MNRDCPVRDGFQQSPNRPTGVLPDSFPFSITFTARRGSKMCLNCLTGKHACESNDCPCTCNDDDFPFPPTEEQRARMYRAQAKGRIPAYVRV